MVVLEEAALYLYIRINVDAACGIPDLAALQFRFRIGFTFDPYAAAGSPARTGAPIRVLYKGSKYDRETA